MYFFSNVGKDETGREARREGGKKRNRKHIKYLVFASRLKPRPLPYVGRILFSCNVRRAVV